MNNPALYVEHTNLNPLITDKDIEQLITDALHYQFVGLCVPPFWVKKVKRDLAHTAIKVVTVVGFPLGYQRTETKVEEVKTAIKDGADELDMVLSLTAFRTNPFWAKVEIRRLAELCHQSEKMLKVIIETAYLSKEEIRTASMMCEEAGADFVKTSTGFATGVSYAGATVEDVQLIRQSVSDIVGIKASGGIKTLAQVESFVQAGAERIGTSSGVQIMKEFEDQTKLNTK